MKTIKRTLILGATFALTGCGLFNLSQKECLSWNWQDRGYKDILNDDGFQIASYTDDCAEYGIRPDATAYNKGAEEALRKYCTNNTAYNKGLENNTYYNSLVFNKGLCEGYNERALRENFNQGLGQYQLNDDLDTINRSISRQLALQAKADRNLRSQYEANIRYLKWQYEQLLRLQGSNLTHYSYGGWKRSLPFPER